MHVSCDDPNIVRCEFDEWTLSFDSASDFEFRQIDTMQGIARSFSLTKDGRILYLVDAAQGLRIFDVSDPVVFDAIGNIETPGVPQFAELSADDSTLFVAVGSAGIFIFDVRNPRVPVLISRKRFDVSATVLQVASDKVFVMETRAVQW